MNLVLSQAFNWSAALARPKNQLLLLDTELVIPNQLQNRYKAGKSIRLAYDWNAELQLAAVRLVQGYSTIGFLPLPDAQQVYAWKKSGKRFSFRVLQAFGDNQQLRIRFTQP